MRSCVKPSKPAGRSAPSRRSKPKKRPGASERLPDLPPETFAIPAGLEVVRASSFFELIRIELKIRKEERDAEKTSPAAPAGS
jgi:hypothetical protein